MRASKFTFLLTVVVLSVLAPQIASAQEDWVQVLSGGNGLAARTRATAMAIFDGRIYVASREPVGSVQVARIFRASILNDTTWIEFSPPWVVSEYVSDMVVFQDQLFVSNSAGDIWRLGLDDVWHIVIPGWTGTPGVHSMSVVKPAAGGYQVCAARGGLEIWCGTADAEWHQLPVPPSLAADPTIGSVKLQAFGRDLYLGVGDDSATSRVCEAWKLTSIRLVHATGALTGDWSNVTSDCFGSHLQWLPAMGAVSNPRPWFFMGTAGHGTPAVIVKTDGRVVTDASPRDLYDYTGGFLSVFPVHNEAMATLGDRLYVGNRTLTSFGAADVIYTDDGATWQFSAQFGFGSIDNNAAMSFASDAGYLYAGVLNEASGFQVWRRRPNLDELGPYFGEDLSGLAAGATGLHKCVFPFDPACVADVAPLHEGIDSIAAGFIRSKGDPQVVQQALSSLKQAHTELNVAQGLLNSADKEPSRGKAQQLRVEAMKHVDAAIDFARAAVKNAQ